MNDNPYREILEEKRKAAETEERAKEEAYATEIRMNREGTQALRQKLEREAVPELELAREALIEQNYRVCIELIDNLGEHAIVTTARLKIEAKPGEKGYQSTTLSLSGTGVKSPLSVELTAPKAVRKNLGTVSPEADLRQHVREFLGEFLKHC